MKLKTSGQEFVSVIKFGIVFGVIFFLFYFFPPTTGLKVQNNMALVVHVLPALSTRIAEHKGVSLRTGQTLLNPPNSSIRDHALEAGHDNNTNFFKIILKSELNSINISESILMKKSSQDLYS